MPKLPFQTQGVSKRSPHDDALARADLALQMQRPHEAEHIASHILKADRNHLRAVTILALALIAQNRAVEAIEPLTKAARRTDDPYVETLLAAAFAAAQRHDEALDLLRKAIERKPAFATAFHDLASYLVKLGRSDEAIAILERGLALLPDRTELKFELGLACLARNDRAKGRAALADAVAAQPGRRDILASLARVLLLDGEYTAAAALYRHALALQADDAMTRVNLGVCQLEVGDRSNGETSLRSAVRGQPQMIGRAIHSLAASSHGRFFLRPSAVTKFLGVEPT